MRDVVGLRISKLRKKKKWTQKDLADRVGISRNYLGNIERGVADKVTYKTLTKIASALNVTVNDLERNIDLLQDFPENRLLVADYMDKLQEVDPFYLKEYIKVTKPLLDHFKNLGSMK